MQTTTPMEALEAHLTTLGPAGLAIRAEGDPGERAQALQTKLLDIHEEMEVIQTKVDAEKREYTQDELDAIDKAYAQFKAAEHQLDALERVTGGTEASRGRRSEPDQLAAGGPGGLGGDPSRPTIISGQGLDARRMRNLFRGRPETEGWGSFQEFTRSIHSGLVDRRFRAATGGSEGVGTEGGFAVPSAYSDRLLDLSLEGEIVRGRADVIGMPSNILDLPLFDDEDHSQNIAGFVAQWLDEAGTATEQTGKLRNVTLKAKKIGIWSKLTSELVEDSPGFEGRLTNAMAQAIGWNFDQGFIRGSGAGQPQGMLTKAPSLITVAKETSQAADSIVYDNVIKMWSRLWPRGAMNAVWMVHPSTLPWLLKLIVFIPNRADSDDVGGTVVTVQGQDGTMRLLTRPVVVTEHVNQLGDAGDIALVDWSQYLVGLRRAITSAREISSGWTTDEVGVRSIARIDGMDTWSKPFQPRTGATLSWCVTLAERA